MKKRNLLPFVMSLALVSCQDFAVEKKVVGQGEFGYAAPRFIKLIVAVDLTPNTREQIVTFSPIWLLIESTGILVCASKSREIMVNANKNNVLSI